MTAIRKHHKPSRALADIREKEELLARLEARIASGETSPRLVLMAGKVRQVVQLLHEMWALNQEARRETR